MRVVDFKHWVLKIGTQLLMRSFLRLPFARTGRLIAVASWMWEEQLLSHWPVRRPASTGWPQTAKILPGLEGASDPCLAELLLQAFPKVVRNRFPGIVYEDARRSARVLSLSSHLFPLPHWSDIPHVTPTELLTHTKHLWCANDSARC